MKYFTLCVPTLHGGKQYLLLIAGSLEEAWNQISIRPEEDGDWDFSNRIKEHEKEKEKENK